MDRVGGRMMKTEPTLLSGLQGTLVWMKAAGIGVEGYATRRCFEIPYERWAPMCLLRDFGPYSPRVLETLSPFCWRAINSSSWC